LRRLWNNNTDIVEALRVCRPDLMTKKGQHFASVLERVFEAQLAKLTDVPAPQNEGAAIDKSALSIGTPRRIRDQEHLERVAILPCLLCGRAPSHAHHLRFAQLRALGSKVSDEWVVPLCNLHHRALHDAGNEEKWWREQGIDALAEAERMWRERRSISEIVPAVLSYDIDHGPSDIELGPGLPAAISAKP